MAYSYEQLVNYANRKAPLTNPHDYKKHTNPVFRLTYNTNQIIVGRTISTFAARPSEHLLTHFEPI